MKTTYVWFEAIRTSWPDVSCLMELADIHNYFFEHHVALNNDWLTDAVSFLHSRQVKLFKIEVWSKAVIRVVVELSTFLSQFEFFICGWECRIFRDLNDFVLLNGPEISLFYVKIDGEGGALRRLYSTVSFTFEASTTGDWALLKTSSWKKNLFCSSQLSFNVDDGTIFELITAFIRLLEFLLPHLCFCW